MEVDPVILQLKAEVGKYQQDVRAATKTVDQQLGLQEKKVRQLETEMRSSSGKISSTIKGLAATLATAFTGRELVGLVDSFTRLQNNLRTAGLEGTALASVQDRLFEVSQRYGVELESLTSVFQKAALVQNELGASTEQILQINEITAAALKITGSSAAEAQGALLQLGQALGSGVVRAEEFNSILEGALPLAQAAARGIDGFGGSVSKLRAAIADGQITSQQFFEGILKGGVQTLEDAEKATLTLSGGFTALTNAMTVYFGEADKANGISAALGSALESLAKNLDVLIPALAIIATGLGVGVVTNAIAARVAVASLGATAAATGKALLAAFGGPVGIAITAVALGLGYIASSSAKAEAEATALSAAIRDNAQKLGTLSGETENATAKTENLSAAEVQAAATAAGLTVESGRLTDQRYRQAAATRAAYIEELKLQAAQAGRAFKEAKQAADRKANGLGDTGYGGGYAGLGGNVRQSIQGSDARREVYADLMGSDVAQDFKQALANLDAARNAPLELPSVPGATSAPGKPKPNPRARTGPDPAREAERIARAVAAYAAEIDQLNADELALRAELSGAIQDRLTAELARIDAAQDAFQRQVALDDELTDAQRAQLVEEQAQVSALQREKARREATLAELEQKLRFESDANRLEQEVVQSQLALAEGREAQKRLAQRLLDLQNSQEQAELEHYIQTLELNGVQSEELTIAKARLARLKTLQENDQRLLDRDFESPAERYTRGLNKTSGEINDALEAIQIEGLEELNDGLVDAIMGAESLGEVFGNVADQIIKDLLRIAIQQAIIKPLAGALFGDSEGGGDGLLGSIFGRASGGRVDGGTIYRINEGASPGRVEAFRPDVGGEIIPLGRMAAAPRGGNAAGGVVRVIIEEAPGFASRVRTEAQGVSVQVVKEAAPLIIDAAANETFARSQRPTI